MESKNNTVNNPTSDMDLQSDTGTLLEIRFLDEKKICRGAVAGGSRFFISLCHECSTNSLTHRRE